MSDINISMNNLYLIIYNHFLKLGKTEVGFQGRKEGLDRQFKDYGPGQCLRVADFKPNPEQFITLRKHEQILHKKLDKFRIPIVIGTTRDSISQECYKNIHLEKILKIFDDYCKENNFTIKDCFEDEPEDETEEESEPEINSDRESDTDYKTDTEPEESETEYESEEYETESSSEDEDIPQPRPRPTGIKRRIDSSSEEESEDEKEKPTPTPRPRRKKFRKQVFLIKINI